MKCIHHAADSFRLVNDGSGQPAGHLPLTFVSATERHGGDVQAHWETQKHHECVKVSKDRVTVHELREGGEKETMYRPGDKAALKEYLGVLNTLL